MSTTFRVGQRIRLLEHLGSPANVAIGTIGEVLEIFPELLRIQFPGQKVVLHKEIVAPDTRS